MKNLNLILLTLLLAVGTVFGQRTVTGTVTDEAGETLPGASVTIKGSDPIIGTVSDLDGNYELEVPESFNTLNFSFTGYTTQEVVLSVDNIVNVTMIEGLAIDDVVVTALGISRDEKSLGYSATEVGGDEIAGSGENNFVQGLAGKVAGVQVIGSGGTPGASSKILLRGNSSFTGENQPLVIVDGVPYDNQTLGSVAGDYPFNGNLAGVNNGNRGFDLNPDDIESMTVLKGPAGAALYGTRAAAGVLIITTKKGKNVKGKKGFDVNFSSNVDISQINKMPELQSTFAQGSGGGDWTDATRTSVDENGAYTTYGLDGSIGTANSWGPRIGSDTFGLQTYDNIGDYFKTAVSFNNNLSISGGNQFSNFRLSYGNSSIDGVVPNTRMNRNTLRLNAQLGSKIFTVSANASYANNFGDRAQNGSNLAGVMLSLTRMPASFNPLGGDGPNGYDNADGTPYNYFIAYDNPLWSAYNNTQINKVNRLTGGLTLSAHPFANWENKPFDLGITYRLGADTYSDYRKQIFAIGSWEPSTLDGEVWENTLRRLEINSDLLITGEKNIGENIFVGVTLGSNLNHRSDEDLFARGSVLTIPNFYNLSNASNLYASESKAVRRLAGLFFDVNFGYKSMIYLNVAGRQDWASTFGAEKRKNGFFYPSASASFVFSELIPQNKIFSFGKLRVAFAQAGLEPPVYSSRTYFTQPFLTDGFTSGLSFPYQGQNGFGYSTVLGNPDLLPELKTSIEAGLDLRFLNGRINLDVTYYRQLSSQLLVQRPIAATSGFEFFNANVGKMVNQGIELLASGDVLKFKKFNWNLNLNFTMNRNEVLELSEGVEEINIESAFSSIGSYAIVGDPYGALYATKWERDANNNLIIDPTGLPIEGERGNVGNPFPDWTMGIRNTFSFYGVSISALLDIRRGGDLWAGTYARLNRLGRTQASADDRSTPLVIPGVKQDVDDQGNAVVDAEGKPVTSGTTNDIQVSPFEYYTYYKGDFGATEEAIYDGSWVRLRELTVSYDFPAKLLKGTKFIQGLNLYFTGRNLWLSTKYPGVDPETSLTGAGSNVNGFDYFNMPSTMSFIVGLRAKF
ncbi:MAG: SusC/RagA family TonB-linked outer membrane protein [Saprospiraceae bacterium]|nr:SusC/RagA family TonB-linked outer membrane protein [Saprospiraceae bacterium]